MGKEIRAFFMPGTRLTYSRNNQAEKSNESSLVDGQEKLWEPVWAVGRLVIGAGRSWTRGGHVCVFTRGYLAWGRENNDAD